MKAGIIGIGYMGSIHAHNLNKLNVEIFLYDIDHEKAKRKAKELCANFIKDFHDFPKVDFFIVSTPAWTHSFYIFNLLSKNVPIFVEKPLVTTYSDFQKIIKEKNKDYIAVGHQLRFSAPYNYIKDLMKKDNDNFEIEFWRHGPCMERKYGGALFDLGIHDLDLAIWIQESPIKKMEIKGNLDDCIITFYHENNNKSIIKTRREINFNAGLKAKSKKTEVYLDFLNNKVRINEHYIYFSCDPYFEEMKEFVEFVEGKRNSYKNSLPQLLYSYLLLFQAAEQLVLSTN